MLTTQLRTSEDRNFGVVSQSIASDSMGMQCLWPAGSQVGSDRSGKGCCGNDLEVQQHELLGGARKARLRAQDAV